MSNGLKKIVAVYADNKTIQKIKDSAVKNKVSTSAFALYKLENKMSSNDFKEIKHFTFKRVDEMNKIMMLVPMQTFKILKSHADSVKTSVNNIVRQVLS